MMRLADFPSASVRHPRVVERMSVEARCCWRSFHRRRFAVFGLFRIVRCPRCERRAFIVAAVTDRDWSRACGDAAGRRPVSREVS